MKTEIEMRDRARLLLRSNILPFWTRRMPDRDRGGFYGRIAGDGRTDPAAPKGAVLNARILWSFSAVCRATGDPLCRQMAVRAKDYLVDRFIDPQYGGVYWSLTAEGKPLETKKQTYALAFALYGLTEYIRATDDRSVLPAAVELFRQLERHARDHRRGGYVEAFARDWQPIGDVRLSDRDANEKKTMNTHLHVIEAYTNLLRVWRDPEAKSCVRELLQLFGERIVRPSGHLGLFFDEDWREKGSVVSYGHDIEASWLLVESADVLGDPQWKDATRLLARRIAEAACEGLLPDGSLRYEYDPSTGRSDDERHWWVQAECVAGFCNAWQRLGLEEGLEYAHRALGFIVNRLADGDGGEWLWSIRPDGEANRVDDKAGFWKCPYHNTRMCLELMERLR